MDECLVCCWVCTLRNQIDELLTSFVWHINTMPNQPTIKFKFKQHAPCVLAVPSAHATYHDYLYRHAIQNQDVFYLFINIFDARCYLICDDMRACATISDNVLIYGPPAEWWDEFQFHSGEKFRMKTENEINFQFPCGFFVAWEIPK